jgi:hypothetical protein
MGDQRLLVHAHEVAILVHQTSGVRDWSAVVHASFSVADSGSSLGVKHIHGLFSSSLYITVVVVSGHVSTSDSLVSESLELLLSFLLSIFSVVTLSYNLLEESLFRIGGVRLVFLRPALNRLEVLHVGWLFGQVIHIPVLLNIYFIREVLFSLLFFVSHFKLVLRSVFFLDISEKHFVVLGPVLLTLL